MTTGQVVAFFAWSGVSAVVLGSIWRRAIRVHAGIRAVVGQVVTEYGLLSINSRKISRFSADVESQPETVRSSDITATTEKQDKTAW